MSSWETKISWRLTRCAVFFLLGLSIFVRGGTYITKEPTTSCNTLGLTEATKTKGWLSPVAVLEAALSPVAAGPPKLKADWLGAEVVAVVLAPGGLNGVPPVRVLGVALDDVEVSPGLAARLGNRLEVLPIIGY
jgi:hypothetical protein